MKGKIRKNPTNSDLFFQRATLYFKNHQIDDAINDLDIAIKLDSTIAKYYIILANYELLKGRSEKVKTTLEKCIRIFPENTKALLMLAKLHLYVKQYKESNNYLKKILRIDKYNPEAYYIRGLIYKENLDTVKAIENIQIAVEYEPEYYDAYILLGLLFSAKSDNIAVDYYNNAIEILPKSIEAHYNLALYYQENNNADKAIEKYNYIISEIDSSISNIYFNLGYVYLVYSDEPENALPYFSKALKIDSNYAEAYYNRGYCYELLNDFENASLDYNKSLDIIPNYSLSINGLNRIEQKLSK